MTRYAVPAAALAALAAGLAVRPPSAPACMAVPRPGERVDVSEEAALIVWDPATKTEHFVRRGSFRTTAADFGFLVPTPSKPDVGPADPGVFDQLAAVTAPKVEYRTVPRPRRGDFGMVASAAPGSKAGAVEVLEQKEFGEYKATVIAFRRGEGETVEAGAAELGKWLKERGYEYGPRLVDWLKPYVEKNWALTAFQVKGGPAGATLTPVRMSFTTDRPFYPYREPTPPPGKADEYTPPRTLRVFLVTPAGRAAGALGADPAGWPGRTVWADKLPAGRLAGVGTAAKLPAALPPGDLWLTEFEDRSSPRPATDEVYFRPAGDQTVVHRPPHVIDVYGPAEGGVDADPGDPAAVMGPGPGPAGRGLLLGGAVAGGVLVLLAVVYAVRVAVRG